MKKLLLFVLLTCLLAVLGATAAVFAPPLASAPEPESAAKSVALTATDIQALIDQGKVQLQSHNILAARDKFAQAVAAAPEHQEANLLYGVTRVFAVFEQNYGSSAELDSVREIFELSGFTFQTFGLYNIEGTEPQQGPAETTPSTGAVLGFVGTRVLPELDAALGNLAKVTSTSFSSTIAPAAIATSGDNIVVDYADALMLKALLNALKCNLNLLVVYGPGVNIPDIGAAPDQLMTYKQLFADSSFLTPREPVRLGYARAALVSFIDTYTAAVPVLKARAGLGHHLFVVDAPLTNEPVGMPAQGLDEVAGALAEIKAALNGAHLFPGSGLEQDRTIDLSKFFNANDPISIRSSLSDCAGARALPDPTFKGLFPQGISEREEFVARYGAQILGVTCANQGAPLIEVQPDYVFMWDSPDWPAENQAISIANKGTAPLHVSSLNFAGPNAADFTVSPGTCASLTPTLQTGTSCSLSVAPKRPASNFGYLHAELRLASDDPSNPSESVQVWGYQQPPPGGVVSGRIKDAASGQGLQGYVSFYDATTGYYVDQTSSDSNGNYSISGLLSGWYKVSFSAWDSRFIHQWYNNKKDQGSADPVQLSSANLSLGETALVQGGMVSGTVKDASSGSGIPYLEVTLYDSQNMSYVASGITSSNGSYSIYRVPSGSYKVKLGNSGGYYAPQWYNGGAAVAVTAPNNVTLNPVQLSPGGSIAGKVRDADTQAAVPGVSVLLYNATSGEYLASATSDGGGAYTVGGLASGSYKVLFNGQQVNYEKLWHANKTSLALATQVALTAPATVPVDAALHKVIPTSTALVSSLNPSNAGQQVSFTATVTASSGTPGGTVFFRNGSTVIGTATLNASGQASLVTAALPAGSHSISAFYDGNSSYNGSNSQPLTQVVHQQLWPLTVTTSGAGSGSVNSSPAGIACATGSSANCSASFDAGVKVILTPTPSSSSQFAGWSGACSGTGQCQVTMDGAKSVGASFSAQQATVRIDGVATPHYSLGATLDTISIQGRTVRARALAFPEQVIMTSPVAILFKGGYTDDAFSTRTSSSVTVLDGSLKIRSGALRVERLVVR